MIQGRQVSFSSACQWLCNGGMRSPSAAFSPPNKRRCGHFAFTTISSAYWLCAGGLKNNNNKKAVLSQGNRAMPQLFFSV